MKKLEKTGMKRTQMCGSLRPEHVNQEAVLMGWVQTRRDLGGVIFIDLRDRTGIAQIVFDAAHLSKSDFAQAERLKNECVIAVSGLIELRSEDTINPLIATGQVDLRASALTLYSEAKNTPFKIGESHNIKEELRLTYRYLDIRSPEMLKHLQLRQKVTQAVRNHLIERECLEVETPILTKSTPEGARDFLVPSRMTKGAFYALPQSPQIYKQLLMVGGIDRYFQIAKCFRDEDLRADRQLEFTQVDMEFSFVDEEDVIEILEALFADLFEKTMGLKIKTPMRRMTYEEAMECYGFDKPDLRFDLPMVDLTALMKTSTFTVFKKVVDQGGVVKALAIKGGQAFTRTQIEYLTERALEHGGSGMAWIAIDEKGTIQSILTKYFTQTQMQMLIELMGAVPGDLIVFCAEPGHKAREVLGHLRLDIGDMLGLRKKDDFAFVIITDFPLFEYDEKAKRYVAMHHPFTSPKVAHFDKEPEKMIAKAYDVVLNGVELGSGSIRIHDKVMQAKMFETLGFTEEAVRERFGFMLDAFEYGVPPHGGFAFGLDRLVMMLVGAQTIREVIAFPKMRDGSCAMMHAPSNVDVQQLEELSLYLSSALEHERVKSTMDLSVIEHVANLSRIALTDAEKVSFAKDLNEVIAFADQLADLDLEGIEPLNHVMGQSNCFRTDEVKPSFDVDALLKSAPERKGNFLFVPKTFE